MNKLIELIKAECKDKGITQNDIARELGCSHATVSLWFCGQQKMSLSKLSAIADMLDLDIGFINTTRLEKQYKELGARELAERLLMRIRKEYGRDMSFKEIWLMLGEETDKYIYKVRE